ncbi:hypothetical protein PVAP13_9NG326446 [Panicum virgatum]|uniref:Uncharacterized protein n=1 Tax=Panicum virgatum TaxID=38727 RepID=A0A8T0MS42_PANVG|nr:hypothetical protein PVAP13_9NG326446 [Panicum virgatum]
MVAKLIAAVEVGRQTDHESKSACWCFSPPSNVTYVAGSSGNGALPSRYCVTCRMLGRAAGDGCRHASPSRSTRSASAASNSEPSLASTAPAMEPLRQCPSTHSASTNRSPAVAAASASSSSSSMGLRPQATSRTNAPKANTSERVVALPVRTSSGAILARPKSPSRPFISPSRSTLLVLMSRWMTTFSQSSCM